MFGKKRKKPSHSWEHKVLAGIDTARDWTAPKVGAAAGWAEKTYRKNAPKVQDASARALRSVNQNAAVAGNKIKELSSKAGDGLASQYDRLPPKAKAEVEKVIAKYDDAKANVKNNYVPAASAKLGDYADATAKKIHKTDVNPRVEAALVKATGDKKIVKKLRKKSEAYAKKTAKALKKQQKAKRRKKALLIFGVVAAGVTAGVAAWRASQPVQDPWKKPEPVTSAKTPATSAKPAAQAETNASAKPQAPKPAAGQTTKPAGAAKPEEKKENGGAVPQPKPAT